MTMTLEQADYLMRVRGWVIFDHVIDNNLLMRLRDDLMKVYELRRAVQIRNGIGDVMSGTCHHLLGENTSMDDFIATAPLHDFIKQFFDSHYILNSFGAFINQPNDTAYVSKVHRDVRTFAGNFRLLLNMLIMLDDFTLDNGATYFLSGSHHVAHKPSDEIFYANASRGVGKAGDIVVFDSNLWHAAGVNKSPHVRRGLTLTYSRPFFKQQIDFPRLLGDDYVKNNELLRQILGYNARVPTTIDEFYQPPEKRAYKAGQE